MKLHEYQTKRLFAENGIPIPKGEVANTPEEAKQIAWGTATIISRFGTIPRPFLLDAVNQTKGKIEKTVAKILKDASKKVTR